MAGSPLNSVFGLSGEVHASETCSARQLNYLYAMGSDTLPPSGRKSRRLGTPGFHHSGQSHFVTFCCYHRIACLRRTQAATFESALVESHPNVAKGATLGWGTPAQLGVIVETSPTLKDRPSGAKARIVCGPGWHG
jgi:hypothetical protein